MISVRPDTLAKHAEVTEPEARNVKEKKKHREKRSWFQPRGLSLGSTPAICTSLNANMLNKSCFTGGFFAGETYALVV